MANLNFNEIIRPFLKPQEELLWHKYENGTAAGENYGSHMLAVDFGVKDKLTAKEKTLHTLMKTVSENEFIQKFFNPAKTFLKEIEFYSIIVKELNKFLREETNNGTKYVGYVPKYYGGQLIEKNQEETLFILENLKIQNYKIADRLKGYNKQETELIVKTLAEFHAIPIAYRQKYPEKFFEKFFPALDRFPIYDTLSKNVMLKIKQKILKVISESEKLQKYLDVFRNILDEQEENIRNPKHEIRDLFATIIHNDLWVNNMLLTYKNDVAVQAKFVDYQIIEYSSAARDLVFLLLISVDNDQIRKNYDYFVRFYYDQFIQVLKDLNADITPFTFDLFLKEMHYEATTVELFHSLIMIVPIFREENDIENLGEINEGNLISGDFTQKGKEKLWMAIETYIEKYLTKK